MTNIAGAPRLQLLATIKRLERERNDARRAAQHWHEQARRNAPWRSWTPERTTAEAQAILDLIGPDPDADAHRRHLAETLADVAGWTRCAKGRNGWCGKRLDRHGLCPRHDHRERRALREAS